MKSTGMVHKVDGLDRIDLPEGVRRNMNMSSNLSGEVSDENIYLANGKLVLSTEEAEQLANEIKAWAQKN